MLYQTKGEVPEESYFLPMGKAEVKREGRDVTSGYLFPYGSQVPVRSREAF